MVLRQPLPSSASTYARDLRTESAAATAAVRRLWRRMGEDFEASWLNVAPDLIRVTDTAQERIATRAQEYIPEVLAETGQRRAARPTLAANAVSLVGTAGDGLPTEGLLYQGVVHARERVAQGATWRQGLSSASTFLSLAVGTLIADTARASETIAMAARPVGGQVRMLNPPSCSRCVILAGRWYRKSTGFQRHPGCDCVHIPASEAVAGDITVDPRAYFDSLDDAGKIKFAGSKANAEAILEHGADINQIVNAYRTGMRTAQLYGRRITYTLEGTTRRGLAYRAMSQAQYVRRQGEMQRVRRGARQWRSPRLMPETILRIAENRADAERLLRLYGWIL